MSNEPIAARLDRLIRLIAVAISEGKTNRQQIATLSRAGFMPAEIAEIIGTTSNTVRVELVQLRKMSKRNTADRKVKIGESKDVGSNDK